jgi:CheY-like chemotaxis protein
MAVLAQIHQVLMNLCINAGHAMQETGGILEVGLADVRLDSEFVSKYPKVIPGSFLRLTVSDTGHGMPPDIMDRIFDPFFTTKGKGEGSGLGLAVVHGIVKSLKGIITAYSQPEKGTTFNIFLPVLERETERKKNTEEPLPTGTERILFVDDEPSLLDLGKKILEPLGYQVEVRSSAVEVLELFKACPERFDLVITDMTMPNMTGDRLSEEMMAIRPDIPVILCTGFSAKMDEKKAKAMGIRAFAFKPILKRDIAVVIRKVLDE